MGWGGSVSRGLSTGGGPGDWGRGGSGTFPGAVGVAASCHAWRRASEALAVVLILGGLRLQPWTRKCARLFWPLYGRRLGDSALCRVKWVASAVLFFAESYWTVACIGSRDCTREKEKAPHARIAG